MKALVTGASGFTGSNLALELKARGHDVRGFVRNPAKAKKLVDAGIELAVGDITDAASVLSAAEGCDIIYHIAAAYREAKHADEVYRQVNVGGTRNVLDAAEHHKVKRVVHCSTVGVHGDVDVPADEGAPFGPGDIYQVTKLEAEKLARARFANGLSGVVVRPAAIYGPGDMRFLKLFRAIDKRTFRMIGTGEVHYHLTFISDLVNGIIRCGERDEAVGNVYIIAGPRYTTLDTLAQAIAKVLKRPLRRGHIPVAPVIGAARLCEIICKPFGIEPPLYVRRVEFFVKSRGFDTDKARQEIGYAPTVDLEEGLGRTAKWYRANGLLEMLMSLSPMLACAGL